MEVDLNTFVATKRFAQMDKRSKAEMAQKLAQMQGFRADYTVGPDLMFYKQQLVMSTEQPATAAPTVWLTPPRSGSLQYNGDPVNGIAPEAAEEESCGAREMLNILAVILAFVVLVRCVARRRPFFRRGVRKRRLIITYQPPGFGVTDMASLNPVVLGNFISKDQPPSYYDCINPKNSITDKKGEEQRFSEVIFSSNKENAPPIRFYEKQDGQKVYETLEPVATDPDQPPPSAIYISMPFDPTERDIDRNIFIGFANRYRPHDIDFGVIVTKDGELEVANKDDWLSDDLRNRNDDETGKPQKANDEAKIQML